MQKSTGIPLRIIIRKKRIFT